MTYIIFAQWWKEKATEQEKLSHHSLDFELQKMAQREAHMTMGSIREAAAVPSKAMPNSFNHTVSGFEHLCILSHSGGLDIFPML